MGSSPHEACRDSYEDIHEVQFTKGFYTKTLEVTQQEWLFFFDDPVFCRAELVTGPRCQAPNKGRIK